MLVHNLRFIVNTTQHSLDLVKDFLLMERLFLVFSALLWSSSYFCDDFCWRIWKKLFVFLKSRSCMRTHSSFGSLVLSWVGCYVSFVHVPHAVGWSSLVSKCDYWRECYWIGLLSFNIGFLAVMWCVWWYGMDIESKTDTRTTVQTKGTVLRIVCIIFVNELNGMEYLKWHDIWTRTESVVIKYQVYFWFRSFFSECSRREETKSCFAILVEDMRQRDIVLRRSRKRMRWDDENNGQLWEKMVLSNARVSIIIVIMIVVASKKETSFFAISRKEDSFLWGTTVCWL